MRQQKKLMQLLMEKNKQYGFDFFFFFLHEISFYLIKIEEKESVSAVTEYEKNHRLCHLFHCNQNQDELFIKYSITPR